MQKFGQLLFPGISDCYQTHQRACRTIKIKDTTGHKVGSPYRSGISVSPSILGVLFPAFTGFELCIK